MNTQKAARKNRFRFSFRKVLLATLVLGCLAGFLGNQFRMHWRDVTFVKELKSIDPRVLVYYDSCVWNEEGLDDPWSQNYGAKYEQQAPFDQPSGPAWLRSWLGKHFFNRVETLSCFRLQVDVDRLPNSPTLKNIFLRSEHIVSVDGVSKFPQLTDLELYNCSQLADCEDLENCKKLEVLCIKDCPKLKSIGQLARLEKLRRVQLDGFETHADLSGLKGAQSLESIQLGIPMNDLDWLCDMPKLRKVELSLPQSVDGMQNLESLETLRVKSNLHQVAIEFSNFKSLKSLSIVNPSLENLKSIDRTLSLEELTIREQRRNPPRSSHSELSGLTRLKVLSLFNNTDTNLDFLSDMRSMQRLHLHGFHNLNRIDGISGMLDLEELILDSNSLTDFSPLDGLPKLRKIWIRGDEVTDLTCFSTMPRLELLRCGQLPTEQVELLKERFPKTQINSGYWSKHEENPVAEP